MVLIEKLSCDTRGGNAKREKMKEEYLKTIK